MQASHDEGRTKRSDEDISPAVGPTTLNSDSSVASDNRSEVHRSKPASEKSWIRWTILLFLLTGLSTFYVQFRSQRDPNRDSNQAQEMFLGMTRWELTTRCRNGFTYSFCLLTILGAHELGHYFQARRYGLPASLPIFIPLPVNQLGTIGAIVLQKSGVASKRALFDIAITGPLAGLAFAIPICWLGVRYADLAYTSDVPDGAELMIYHSPPLLNWLKHIVYGAVLDKKDVLMNPALLAGWFGILITAVNLAPIGQLDGGHILYCLVGPRANAAAKVLFLVAAIAVGVAVLLGNRGYLVWWLMLVMVWLIGTRHPPTADDEAPLGRVRMILGWLTLTFMFVGITATPFEIEAGTAGRLSPAAAANSHSPVQSATGGNRAE
jgi:Zn-dependent protease